MAERPKDAPYLIWSNQHRAWWRPNSSGYTKHVEAAGRYTRAEAISISSSGRDGWIRGTVPDEIPVLAADAIECDAANATDRAGGEHG